MAETRAFVFSRLVFAAIALIATHAFAQNDLDEIPPPEASPETGEMVKVPEESELPGGIPATKAPSPKPAPKPVPPPAKPVAAPKPAGPTTPAANSKFVPIGSPEAAPAASATPPPAAQVPPKPKSQRGGVVAEEATVFKDANFDSEVIATVKAGTIMEMSVGKKDMFYKVRVKPGMTGFISDAEIKPINADGSVVVPAEPELKTKSKTPNRKTVKKDPKTGKPIASKKKKAKPIQLQKYRGLVFENINFTEDTMLKVRSANMTFFGFRWSGNDVVIPGQMYTDAEILFHSGAPSYYQDATGNSAGGMILTGNFLVVFDVPQSRDLMAYYGFGPMFRFSQFQVDLNNDPTAGKTKGYTLTDATIGGLIGAGIAVAIGDKYAVRLDGRYYWEAQRYTSFSLAIQTEW